MLRDFTLYVVGYTFVVRAGGCDGREEGALRWVLLVLGCVEADFLQVDLNTETDSGGCR